MASFGGDDLGWIALLATIASNFAFAARAVLVKALKREHHNSPCARSDALLFFRVSSIGAIWLLPLGLWDVYSSRSELASQMQYRCYALPP